MFKKRGLIFLFFIVLIGLVPLLDLFNNGLPLTHDGKDHVARIANFYQSLSEGNVIPRWGAHLNWGFGHPVLMFLYPLSSYAASLFHFVGFSLIDSLKIVFAVSFVLSGVGMYLWVNRLFGSYSGVLAAILYMTAPYRFVNLYVRGAIGEHVSFAFIPFVLFFVTKIFLNKKSSKRLLFVHLVGVSVFTALLILSHNALSILFLVFAAFYTLILFYNNKDARKLALVFISVVYGFLLSVFFWLPAYVEGKYTLRDVVTGSSEYVGRFVTSPMEFIVPSWSYGITGQLSVQIGVLHIALVLISVYIAFKLPAKEKLVKSIFMLTGIFFLLSLFMMLKQSDFIWSLISIIQKFQFPWRFLSLTVLTSSFLGAFCLYSIKKENKKIFAIAMILVLVVFFYGSYWRANDYLLKNDAFFKDIYHGTTDTGESSPVWSIRFMEEEAIAPIEIISGSASIQEISRSSVIHEYEIDALERSRIKENTLYFPGWNIYVNDRKLDTNTEIEFQDPQYRGVMTFWVDSGKSNIRIVFEDTKLRLISNLISTSAFVLLAVFVLKIFIMKNKK